MPSARKPVNSTRLMIPTMVNCGGVRPDGWMRGIVALTAVVPKLMATTTTASTSAAIPSFMCKSTRRAATSRVCAMKTSSQAVNTRLCKCTRVSSGGRCGPETQVVRLDHVVQIPPIILVPVDVDSAGARLAWIQRRRARPSPKAVVPLIANRQDCLVAADRDALAKETALGIVPPGTRCQRDLLLVDAVFPLEHLDFRRPVLGLGRSSRDLRRDHRRCRRSRCRHARTRTRCSRTSATADPHAWSS